MQLFTNEKNGMVVLKGVSWIYKV